MDEKLLEIREYDGEGYKALVDYGGWRVAILRYLDEIQPDQIKEMECHIETDEVFVLIQGSAVLLMGGIQRKWTGSTHRPWKWEKSITSNAMVGIPFYLAGTPAWSWWKTATLVHLIQNIQA